MLLERSTLSHPINIPFNKKTPLLALVDRKKEGRRLSYALIAVSCLLLLQTSLLFAVSYYLFGFVSLELFGIAAVYLMTYLAGLCFVNNDLAAAVISIGQIHLLALQQYGKLIATSIGATVLFVCGRLMHGGDMHHTLLWGILFALTTTSSFIFIVASLLRKRLLAALEKMGIVGLNAPMLEELSQASFVLVTDELLLDSDASLRDSIKESIKEMRLQGLQVIYLSSYGQEKAFEIAQQASLTQLTLQVLSLDSINDVSIDDPQELYSFFASVKVFTSVTDVQVQQLIAIMKQCTRSVVLVSNMILDHDALQVRLTTSGAYAVQIAAPIIIKPDLTLIARAYRKANANTVRFMALLNRQYVIIGGLFVLLQISSFFNYLPTNDLWPYVLGGGLLSHGLLLLSVLS